MSSSNQFEVSGGFVSGSLIINAATGDITTLLSEYGMGS
jgi:hypothetical protein